MSPYRLATVAALFIAAWALYGYGQRYDACLTAQRSDAERLAKLDAAMTERLDRLKAVLRQGPLDPAAHVLEPILAGDDPTEEAFRTLGNWIDPSVPVPSWNGDKTPVPTGLPADVLFRLRFTEFSNIQMQAGIIAAHLAMRNDPDLNLAHNHQAALLRELDWLDAVNAGSSPPMLSPMRCIVR